MTRQTNGTLTAELNQICSPNRLLWNSQGDTSKNPSMRRIRNDTLGISRADCGSSAVLRKPLLTHEAHQQ